MADFALVVGIEKYDTPPAPELNGPAPHAMRFALWLRRAQKLPAENIVLIVNNSEAHPATLEELRAESIAIKHDPSLRTIKKAWREDLLAGPNEPGTVWFYWSGHGFTLPQSRDALLCADNENGDPTFLYLSEIRDSLCHFDYRRFHEQRLIVDACAEFLTAEDLALHTTRNPETWTISETPWQVELNAVARGQTALAQKGSNLFSRVLLAQLESGGWPADIKEFHQALSAAIAAEVPGQPGPRLRTPNYEAGFDAGNHAAKSRSLLGMLSGCNIPFDRYQPFYVRTMGGLTSAPEVLAAATLTDMIRELLELPAEEIFGGYSKGLVEFLARVHREYKTESAAIDNWLCKNVQEGARRTVQDQLDREDSQLVLTIHLKETAASVTGFPLSISAHLSDANFARTIQTWNISDVKDSAELETHARTMLNHADRHASRQKDVNVSVQVFANPPLMGIPWHRFRIDPADEDESAFGELHPFVLRSRGRLARSTGYDLASWRGKAKALRTRPCGSIAFKSAPPWSKDVRDELSTVDGLLFLNDTLGAPSEATANLYKLLSTALKRGVPLASWRVAHTDDPPASTGFAELEPEVKALFRACNAIGQMPVQLRDARRSKAWARQTALFWDDDDDCDKLLRLVGEETMNYE